jgi:hypothetical protein
MTGEAGIIMVVSLAVGGIINILFPFLLFYVGLIIAKNLRKSSMARKSMMITMKKMKNNKQRRGHTRRFFIFPKTSPFNRVHFLGYSPQVLDNINILWT